jgi:colanic acid biosynthesis glycosyl transferase WcaI
VVVHPVEPAAIAEAVRRMARSADDAQRMGRAGRAYAEAHFSRGAVTRQYAQLMDEAVAAARG